MKHFILPSLVFVFSSTLWALPQNQRSNGASQTHPDQNYEQTSNGASQTHPDQDYGGKKPKNPGKPKLPPKNPKPPKIDPRDQACDAIAFEFGRGEIPCHRNWFICTEAEIHGKILCNFTLEVVANVIKGPLNVIEEAYQGAEEWGAEAGDYFPVVGHLVGGVLGGAYGSVKGAFESSVGILAGVVEISGEHAVIESDYFEY